MTRTVVVLDYGSGNTHSAVRALERVGAAVTLTADPAAALNADGLIVPGVGNFHACMSGLGQFGCFCRVLGWAGPLLFGLGRVANQQK